MGDVVDWVKDFLLGSEGEIDWDELRKMMDFQNEINKTDRTGMFTGWEWERDAEGNPLNRQVQTVNPAFQDAVNRLGYNAGKPADPYSAPSQFDQMLDAKMANQMDRQGIDNQYNEYQDAQPQQPWQPSADRPGMGDTAGAFLPPLPGEEGTGEYPNFEIEPSEQAGMPPVQEPWEASPGDGLPGDYYNDKGNIRRKYRPGNRNYVGDEELRRWAEDPNYAGPALPDDYMNDKGNVRRRYRGQEYYGNPNNPDNAIFGPGTGAPDDWLNDQGNIRRRYREGSNQYGGNDYQTPGYEQPADWLNDKGNVRRKYRTGG